MNRIVIFLLTAFVCVSGIAKADDAVAVPRTDIVSMEQLTKSIDGAVDRYLTNKSTEAHRPKKLEAEVGGLITSAAEANRRDFLDIAEILEKTYMEKLTVSRKEFKDSKDIPLTKENAAEFEARLRRLDDAQLAVWAVRSATIEKVIVPMMKEITNQERSIRNVKKLLEQETK